MNEINWNHQPPIKFSVHEGYISNVKAKKVMNNYTNHIIDEWFERGKRYLNNERFKDAIDVYDKLISGNFQFLNKKDEAILLQTSLINRGLAKCKLARITYNLDLYKDGVSDFKKSIKIANPQTENERFYLSAYKCLQQHRIGSWN